MADLKQITLDEIYRLHVVEKLSSREIAKIVGRSHVTITRSINKSRKQIELDYKNANLGDSIKTYQDEIKELRRRRGLLDDTKTRSYLEYTKMICDLEERITELRGWLDRKYVNQLVLDQSQHTHITYDFDNMSNDELNSYLINKLRG